MGKIELVSVGFQATVQDVGRRGYQEYGVPVSGTVVPDWMKLANALVGNPPDAAGIEFRLLGPTLRALDDDVKVAVAGDCDVVLNSTSDTGVQTWSVGPWRSFTLAQGDEVKISALEGSATGFVAFSGGIDSDHVMGSRSVYARSLIGGSYLENGQTLNLFAPSRNLVKEADRILPVPPRQQNEYEIRIVFGPQDDYFEDEEKNKLLQAPYVISKEADRMGCRLDGKALSHRDDKGAEIISDGVVCGAIQVPGNGQPIILLNDGQTVGGYPKIATVISADIQKIANALPGTRLKFIAVSPREACDLARKSVEALEGLKRSIISASANGFVNMKALYETNIIGGVVDMSNPDHFAGSLDLEES